MGLALYVCMYVCKYVGGLIYFCEVINEVKLCFSTRSGCSGRQETPPTHRAFPTVATPFVTQHQIDIAF
ncbi:hypothetical protein BDV36DRAFT_252080 [Aspergillus pseudocaelatus]|uniref:Secreted protein n=1 Tax=Aspergillus pseudocaelatus TaxID=1825620 RepID=A0ABQ6WRG6_9EURO|nr:hypothetical protein BDV36DRAFT_252080 [Aspergillus pseudocaelatus]